MKNTMCRSTNYVWAFVFWRNENMIENTISIYQLKNRVLPRDIYRLIQIMKKRKQDKLDKLSLRMVYLLVVIIRRKNNFNHKKFEKYDVLLTVFSESHTYLFLEKDLAVSFICLCFKKLQKTNNEDFSRNTKTEH